MDLYPTVEEEYRLVVHNEERDAWAFIVIGNDDAPGTRTGIGYTSPLLLMEAILVLVVAPVPTPQGRDLKCGMTSKS